MVTNSPHGSISCFKRLYYIFPNGKSQVTFKYFSGFSVCCSVLFFRRLFDRGQLDLHFCLSLVILCFDCRKPKLKQICCWKQRISQKPQRDSWAPDNYSDHTLKTACWIILKSPNLSGFRRSTPRSQRLTRG